MIDEGLLLNVHRPAQYLGHEWNASGKEISSCAISFALGFPDLYEIGMSNLGLRIIYGVLNNIPDVACERFFAPEADMEAALRNSGRRLFSLESGRELSGFDFLGFSLGSELNYTNVLNVLDLAGVPLQAKLRDYRMPLVIGGGPCVLNPEPIADFFDLFIIGEAEEAAAEVIDIYRRRKQDYKNGALAKEDLLAELSHVEGIYAPALYKPGRKVRKRVVENLDSAFFPCNWIVPFVQTVHDRITLEVMRGCPNRCRFCQARSQYYPLRIRSREKVVSLANSAYALSGYEELSLAGLSVSDYPAIEKVVSDLTASFKERAVNLSLPSLKARALLGNVTSLIAGIKKTGLTFAPEAGTHRLRQAIAKDFSEEDFFRAIEEAYRVGYQHLKLYFLIGLPGEKDEDLDGIIDFAAAASDLKKKVSGGGAQINISINPLIPKPHTPLQWMKMEPVSRIREKQAYLRSRCKNKRLKISFHNIEMGFLEGVFSRGDRRLGAVIACAYRKGARFDAWPSSFSFSRWQEAFSEAGIDPQEYLEERSVSDTLPWDFIDIGIKKEYLIEEFNKSIVI
ncbi:MAG: TIGR03960 family B12-binding radical SAM protein [Candidatus Omnitrophica bacterium]|nr:TIGR03960 family B12-binding radical SAM protein [Candidatus Omnitrophota bacterium]MDD5770900.1 TIGR03960 family B12-binding radical SAM protein [Candidatus Omnitrophota bacterium]